MRQKMGLEADYGGIERLPRLGEPILRPSSLKPQNPRNPNKSSALMPQEAKEALKKKKKQASPTAWPGCSSLHVSVAPQGSSFSSPADICLPGATTVGGIYNCK